MLVGYFVVRNTNCLVMFFSTNYSFIDAFGYVFLRDLLLKGGDPKNRFKKNDNLPFICNEVWCGRSGG